MIHSTLKTKILLTFCAIFVSGFFVPVHQAHAIPVFDSAAFAQMLKSFSLDGKVLGNTALQVTESVKQTSLDVAQNAKEYGLDGIAWQLSNAALESMLVSTTQWVNSGFEGNPTFITNFEDYMLFVGDQVAGKFLQDIGLGALCTPFKFQIQYALEVWYTRSQQSYLGTCSLSQVVGNIETFLDDPTRGGWEGWYQFAVSGQSDPYSQFIQVRTSLQENLTNKKDAETDKAVGNNFFLGKERCEDVETANGGTERKCETITPGVTASEALSSALDIPKEKLTVADEIDELIGTLFTQLTAQVFSGGSGGLRGLSTPVGGGPPGSRSYLEQITQDRSTIGYNNNSARLFDSYIQTEETHRTLQQSVVSAVNAAQTARSTCPAGTGNLPSSITSRRDSANQNITQADTNITTLQTLRGNLNALEDEDTPESGIQTILRTYNASSTARAHANILEQLNNLQSSGTLHTEGQNSELRVTIIPALTDEIAALPACASAAPTSITLPDGTVFDLRDITF